jgi:hypothetical protein
LKIFCLDKASLNGVWTEFKDGRLILPVTLTRTGVFKYLYSDIFGNTENKDYPKNMFKDGVIRVLRSYDEVLKSIDSMRGMYFTDEHPNVTVNSDNQKALSKGQVSTVINIREEKYNDYSIHYFDSEIVVIDKNTQEIIKQKIKDELSLGYEAGIVFNSGTWVNGELYDAQQVDIQNNHTALVKRGRAGEKVKIKSKFGDVNTVYELDKENITKEIYVMDLRGIKINFSDSTSESVVEQELKTLQEKVKLIDSLEAKNLKLEKDLQDAKNFNIEAIAEERLNIISKAKLYVKDSDFKGQSNLEIMKSAVSEFYKGKDLKDKSEAFFKDSFDLLDSEIKENKQKVSVRDSFTNTPQPKQEVNIIDSLAEQLANAYNKGVK